jgi:hypothetical protein
LVGVESRLVRVARSSSSGLVVLLDLS